MPADTARKQPRAKAASSPSPLPYDMVRRIVLAQLAKDRRIAARRMERAGRNGQHKPEDERHG